MDELTREFLSESYDGIGRMEQCLTELDSRPDDRDLLAEIFRVVHTIKGSTGFLGFTRLESLAHAGENLLAAIRADRVAVTTEIINALLGLHDRLREVLKLIESAGNEGQRSTDEDDDLIGCMMAFAAALHEPNEPFPAGTPSEARTGIVAEADEEVPGPRLDFGAEIERPVASTARDLTVRVDVEVLNRLMNLVSELVLTRNSIVQHATASQQSAGLARRLDAVTSELRNVVMQARMQPVNQLFGKFPRMVRDLARLCGRRVRLSFEGQGTELDKSLIEAVRDPLTHTIRNAIDHGIEPPEERLRLGKDAEGVIRLRAYSQSGSVVIEVSDDGAGISVERVLARAVERGLVAPEHAAQMSSGEALKLLFEPGFSTSESVSYISGRGVGLDIVRSNVEKVGGHVEIQSTPGQGTVVRLRMPLTLAIVPALIVRGGDQCFALPQSRMIELFYMTAEELRHSVEIIGSIQLFHLRDALYQLVDLREVVGFENASPLAARYVALVEGDGRRYALLIDEILQPEEIVVKPLSALLRQSGIFAAAGMLGSGDLALILDIGGIGARAGIPSNAGDFSRDASIHDAFPNSAPHSRVLRYEIERGASGPVMVDQLGVPLDCVERITTAERDALQWSRGRLFLPYSNELLPVEDEGNLVTRSDRQSFTILVLKGPPRVGVIVHRVVDICEFKPGEMNDDVTLTLLGDVVTEIRRVSSSFEEVA